MLRIGGFMFRRTVVPAGMVQYVLHVVHVQEDGCTGRYGTVCVTCGSCLYSIIILQCTVQIKHKNPVL